MTIQQAVSIQYRNVMDGRMGGRTELLLYQYQASSFFNKNLTNADNDNSMNMSTKMEMSQVNKPANNVQTMQYVKINIQTYKHQ